MGMSDRDRAWGRLKQHRHYPYRACAPHWDNPRVCAADERVPLGVFFTPDGEGQKARLTRETTAKRLCGGCPIAEACREYAIGDGPRVRERHQIWGGTTPVERRDILARRRQAALAADEPLPLDLLRTTQKQTILAALAQHDGDFGKVCAEAGMDGRTVLWHLARLYTLLRVPRPEAGREHVSEHLWAGRRQLVAAARTAGLLPEAQPEPARRFVRVRAPRRDRFRYIPGQTEITFGSGADIIPFAPARPALIPQEAAA